MSRAEMAVVSPTEFNVVHMAKMIQVRNVPDEMHRELKARAAYEGISLSDLIKRELEWVTSKMSKAEMERRFQERKPNSRIKPGATVEIIREARGEI
jgi:plasmid stability protein